MQNLVIPVQRVSIGQAENGLEIEIVGEIAKMVELGIGSRAQQAADLFCTAH